MLSWILMALLMQSAVANDHEYIDVKRINASELYEKYVRDNNVTDTAKKKELKELFQFRDFVGKTMDGRQVNFHLKSERNYKPARVLILSYTAEWCKNCNYEAPYLNELYQKHHARGLEIVTRTEYSEVEKVKVFVDKYKMPYPVIIGSVVAYSERQKIRLETFQYLLRSTLGDKRTWGTPFSVIIVNGDIENPYVVMGEMISDQVNQLIERSLGSSNQ